ncbi:MAG: hypothetical protein M1818_003024 [Claussenomyces sp. TS43310]|nr:MAG: hypothetical protein M1818_003024 [Claussenomyces sp. TS43310]
MAYNRLGEEPSRNDPFEEHEMTSNLGTLRAHDEELPDPEGEAQIGQNYLRPSYEDPGDGESTSTSALDEEHLNPPVKTDTTQAALPTAKWGIGWKTLTIITVFYLFGEAHLEPLIVATGHLILLRYIDGMLVPPDTIFRQSYVSAASTALVFGFRSAMTISLTTAFSQRAWYIFRTRSLKVPTINSLLSSPRSVVNILSGDLIKSATLEWLFAVFCFLVPIGTVFPPGALTVGLQPHVTVVNTTVPIFDPYGRNHTTDYRSTLGGGLFAMDDAWPYAANMVKPPVLRIAQQALFAQAPVFGLSPCGSNCSYSLDFVGATFKCNNQSNQNISLTDISNWYGLQGGDYIARKGNFNGLFQFETHFEPFVGMSIEPHNPEQVLNCIPRVGNYHLDIRYLNGTVHSSDVSVEAQSLLNATWMTYPNQTLFPTVAANEGLLPMFQRAGDNDSAAYEAEESLDNVTWPDDTPLQIGTNLSYAYMSLNLASLYDTLTTILGGSVGSYGMDGQSINDTLVLASTLAMTNTTSSADRLDFNLTQTSMSALLHNITISAITLSPYTTTTMATRTSYMPTYMLSHPLNLYVPYGLTLVIALAFLIIGITSLWRNGVAATDDFIQILQTTAARSEVLDQARIGTTLGGEENVHKPLEALRLRYGGLIEKGEDRVERAGWGIEGEVERLRKNRAYH